MLSNGFHTVHNKPARSKSSPNAHTNATSPQTLITAKKNVLKIIDNEKNKRYNYNATQYVTGEVETSLILFQFSNARFNIVFLLF